MKLCWTFRLLCFVCFFRARRALKHMQTFIQHRRDDTLNTIFFKLFGCHNIQTSALYLNAINSPVVRKNRAAASTIKPRYRQKYFKFSMRMEIKKLKQQFNTYCSDVDWLVPNKTYRKKFWRIFHLLGSSRPLENCSDINKITIIAFAKKKTYLPK